MKNTIAIATIFLLTGCAGSGSKESAPRAYDLGVDLPAMRLSAVRPLPVRAASPFDTNDMLYRLAFRNPSELHAFSESRWASTPAILIQRRFLRASSDGYAKCAFEFELAEFTQVFASTSASEFVLEGRASVTAPGAGRVAERQFRVRDPDAGANAASGVAGVTRAVDRLIGEIDYWASTITACKAG